MREREGLLDFGRLTFGAAVSQGVRGPNSIRRRIGREVEAIRETAVSIRIVAAQGKRTGTHGAFRPFLEGVGRFVTPRTQYGNHAGPRGSQRSQHALAKTLSADRRLTEVNTTHRERQGLDGQFRRDPRVRGVGMGFPEARAESQHLDRHAGLEQRHHPA